MFEDRRHFLTALFCLVGCDQADSLMPVTPADKWTPPSASATESSLTPTFIDADIPQIYQVLLLNGLAPFEKTERWSHFYKQRWVRWCGQLTHVKPDALWFKHLDSSMTYDVLLRTARAPGQAPLKLQVGRFYNYIGRLDRYDDGFHTMYLDQGVVRDAGPDGVPGTFSVIPEQTRQVPPPPKVEPPTPPQ